MEKLKQKIILFIEPSANSRETPCEIANSYLNRFSIDEEAADDIMCIYHFQKRQHNQNEHENKKGMDR